MKRGSIKEAEANDKKFAHKKSLGQNFLTSDIVPGWMVEAGEVTTSDTVLEIGPGTGMLTRAILKTGAHVVAIEADPRAILELEANFPKEIENKQLVIHRGDAREITPSTLGLVAGKFKVVANIPYYLSGFLLRLMLESEIQPEILVFLIQKELATRIVKDKKESILSLSVKAFGEPHIYKKVSRGHFLPQPKVDSAILAIKNINLGNFKEFTPAFFFTLVHLGLGKKRKQLLANLSIKYTRDQLQTIFTNLDISLTVRGEDLALDTWLSLVKVLSDLD